MIYCYDFRMREMRVTANARGIRITADGLLVLAAMLVYMASPVVISCLPTGK